MLLSDKKGSVADSNVNRRNHVRPFCEGKENRQAILVRSEGRRSNSPLFDGATKGAMNYATKLAEWKRRHGINPGRDVNQDELLMVAEDSRSKEKDWCVGCGEELPVREMKIITRSIDPYMQTWEGESDYIPNSERVRMCHECFKENHEAA